MCINIHDRICHIDRSHNKDAQSENENSPPPNNGYESDFESSDEQSQQYKNQVTKQQQRRQQQQQQQVLASQEANADEVVEDNDILVDFDNDEDDTLKTLTKLIIGAEVNFLLKEIKRSSTTGKPGSNCF